jgi:hypothetical protein
MDEYLELKTYIDLYQFEGSIVDIMELRANVND